MVKIVFLDYATLGGAKLDAIREVGELVLYELTSAEQVVERAIDADVVITNKVMISDDTLSLLPRLKLICVAATGVNNIDLDACKKRGVAVCNVKGYSTPSVVQIAFSSLFQYISKISFFDAFVKGGGYSASRTFTCMDEQFFEISGKNIGIVGFGEIGKSMAVVARSFGMNVVYYSTSGRNDEKNFSRVRLDELCEVSDVISVHCALNENTKNLISTELLSKMKKDAILMNFARGGVVDEAAVASAIDAGVIGVYIADVFEKEPIEKTSPLLNVQKKERLVLTPHIAWASVEARERLLAAIGANIKDFLDAKQTNRVV